MEQYGLAQSEDVIAQVKDIAESITFNDPIQIGRYGELPQGNRKIEGVVLGDNSPTTRAAELIGQIVVGLEKADPSVLTKRESWWSRYTGSAMTRRVAFFSSADSVDQLLEQVPERIADMEVAIGALMDMRKVYSMDLQHIRIHLTAGKFALSKMSSDTASSKGAAFGTEAPTERFARRLSHLAAMLATTELAMNQLTLAESNMINMMDRLREVASVLVPAWHHKRVALHLGTETDFEVVNAATQAHDQLLSALKTISPSS